MADTPKSLAERLQREGERTIEFFQALTPEQWEHSLYTDGAAWKVGQVLAHTVGAEHSLTRLVENILAGGAGTPEDFNLDAYNERKVAEMQALSREQLMERFAALRSRTAALVAGLTPEDLQKTGRHPWLGVAALEDIIKLIYRHNQIHQRDIRKALDEHP
ncbi:MAG: ClbS/DfsB family four-helix bundle protein [Chloroflexi bacterium]|nr:ClbS/DfsB family four-helix bundle protein [Chloroflexota bacterium]